MLKEGQRHAGKTGQVPVENFPRLDYNKGWHRGLFLYGKEQGQMSDADGEKRFSERM